MNDENGYALKLPSTQDRGQLIMHFYTGSLVPDKVIRYNAKDNDIDYVLLTLTNVRYNITFPLTFFDAVNSLSTDSNTFNTAKIESLPNKSGNSNLLVIGTKAPEWELLNSEGIKKRLSDFKGKVVVLDFWATWCAPCIQAQPLLQSIHERYKDVVVLGMDFNDKAGVDLNTYKVKKKIDYEMILNAEKIADLYNIKALPTVYVIDKSGSVIYSSLGYTETESRELTLVIENAIK